MGKTESESTKKSAGRSLDTDSVERIDRKIGSEDQYEHFHFHNISVTIWTFPSKIYQSTIDGRQHSNACTVISLLLCHKFFADELQTDELQTDEQLPQKWVTHMRSCMRNGNKYYTDDENLELDEAIKIVKKKDQTIEIISEDCSEVLQLSLQKMRKRENTSIILINNKTIK